MDQPGGLRERKKAATRTLIADAAVRLFAERGFEAVTVAQVARAADVSEATVFNYFATKESLFYSQMEAFEDTLVAAVRDRPPGEAVLTAFRRVIDDGTTRLALDPTADAIALAAGIVAASPTLQVRERELIAEATGELAALLAAEGHGHSAGIEAMVVAHALMGAHRCIVVRVRADVLAGRRGPKLARRARKHSTRAFEVLAEGLGAYGVRPGGSAAS